VFNALITVVAVRAFPKRVICLAVSACIPGRMKQLCLVPRYASHDTAQRRWALDELQVCRFEAPTF